MKRLMVKYKVKSDRSEENATLVRNVFDELAENQPGGLQYVTFRLEDNVTFIHIASIETDDGSNPLAESVAFKKFQKAIGDRCVEPPKAVNLETIGAFRIFN